MQISTIMKRNKKTFIQLIDMFINIHQYSLMFDHERQESST